MRLSYCLNSIVDENKTLTWRSVEVLSFHCSPSWPSHVPSRERHTLPQLQHYTTQSNHSRPNFVARKTVFIRYLCVKFKTTFRTYLYKFGLNLTVPPPVVCKTSHSITYVKRNFIKKFTWTTCSIKEDICHSATYTEVDFGRSWRVVTGEKDVKDVAASRVRSTFRSTRVEQRTIKHSDHIYSQ